MLLPLLMTVALSQDPAAAAEPAEPAESTAAAPAETTGLTEVPSAASADASISLGLKAFKRHRYNQAEIEFRRAMEVDPSSAAAAFYLGYTYYKAAEHKRPFHPDKQKSAELFARAFELDPHFKPVWSR